MRQEPFRTLTRRSPMDRSRIPISNDKNTLSPGLAHHYIQVTASTNHTSSTAAENSLNGPQTQISLQSDPKNAPFSPLTPCRHPPPSEDRPIYRTAKQAAFNQWHLIFNHMQPKSYTKWQKKRSLPLHLSSDRAIRHSTAEVVRMAYSALKHTLVLPILVT